MHVPVCACISVCMCVCISLCSVCVYVSEYVCTCMHTPCVCVSIEAKRGCRIVRFPVARVTGSCELPNISAGNSTLALRKSSKFLNHGAISPASDAIFFYATKLCVCCLFYLEKSPSLCLSFILT